MSNPITNKNSNIGCFSMPCNNENQKNNNRYFPLIDEYYPKNQREPENIQTPEGNNHYNKNNFKANRKSSNFQKTVPTNPKNEKQKQLDLFDLFDTCSNQPSPIQEQESQYEKIPSSICNNFYIYIREPLQDEYQVQNMSIGEIQYKSNFSTTISQKLEKNNIEKLTEIEYKYFEQIDKNVELNTEIFNLKNEINSLKEEKITLRDNLDDVTSKFKIIKSILEEKVKLAEKNVLKDQENSNCVSKLYTLIDVLKLKIKHLESKLEEKTII